MSDPKTPATPQPVQSSAAANEQIEIQIDDQNADCFYSTTSRVWGSAEEVYLDFSTGLRAAGNKQAVMNVQKRMIVSPWAAKRLSMALAQVVSNYERTYGTLELDQRKRQKPAAPPEPGSN